MRGQRRVWPRPTRRAGVLLLLGVVLYGAGANASAAWVLALAAGVLGAVPWAWLVARRAAAGLEIHRQVPARATAGVPVTAGVHVRAPVAAPAVVHDHLAGAVGHVASLHAGAELSATVILRRGELRGGRVAVELTDPLALWRVRLGRDVPGRVLVLPAVPELPVTLQASGLAGDGVAEGSRHGAGPEVFGVREYRSGDPLRAVHWRGTARRGQPVVRELADRSRQRLRVEVAAATWERAALDRAAEVAGALAAAARRAGWPAEVAADGWALPWSPDARVALALLPPHAGAGPRPLAAPSPAAAADTVVRLEPAAGGVAVLAVAGDRARALAIIPSGGSAEQALDALAGAGARA